MLRWFWPISEYNLKIRDLCGNIEGGDLKNNSQSTTHIDPKVGTGGKLHVLAYNEENVMASAIG